MPDGRPEDEDAAAVRKTGELVGTRDARTHVCAQRKHIVCAPARQHTLTPAHACMRPCVHVQWFDDDGVRVRKIAVLSARVLYHHAPPPAGSGAHAASDWCAQRQRGAHALVRCTAVDASGVEDDGSGQRLYGFYIVCENKRFDFYAESEVQRSLWLQSIFKASAAAAAATADAVDESRSAMEDMLRKIARKHAVQIDVEGPQSTLGIVVTGVRVVSVVPGSPAALPHRERRYGHAVLIEPGDTLLQVDGVPITAENAPELLRGSDEVGSLACIRLEKCPPKQAEDKTGRRGESNRHSWGSSGNRNSGGSSQKQLPGEEVEILIARQSIARILPLSQMVLAMAKLADPKTKSVASDDVHNLKRLADDFMAVESRHFEASEARMRGLEELALAGIVSCRKVSWLPMPDLCRVCVCVCARAHW